MPKGQLGMITSDTWRSHFVQHMNSILRGKASLLFPTPLLLNSWELSTPFLWTEAHTLARPIVQDISPLHSSDGRKLFFLPTCPGALLYSLTPPPLGMHSPIMDGTVDLQVFWAIRWVTLVKQLDQIWGKTEESLQEIVSAVMPSLVSFNTTCSLYRFPQN